MPLSRYTEWSTVAICWSSVAAFTPAGELNAACFWSGVRIDPPACHRSASKRHTVSSLASFTYAQPNCLAAGFVSFFAAARKSSHVQFAVGYGMCAWLNSFLL